MWPFFPHKVIPIQQGLKQDVQRDDVIRPCTS